MNRAGKQAVRYELPIKFGGRPEKAKFKAVDLDPSFLANIESGQAAVEALCRHYAVDLYGSRLEVTGRSARMIDADGNSLDDLMVWYAMRDGYVLERGEQAAADQLEAGIESCDASLIRQAVANGARLDVLPGRRLTPLKLALSKSADPKGAECVSVLVELGCPVEGEPGDEPLLHWCNGNPDQMKLLLSLGANVNAIEPRNGRTALNSMSALNIECIRLLMQHGADPSIRNHDGQTIIDFLNWRISRAEEHRHSFKEAQHYRELLSLVTGVAAEEPGWEGKSKYSLIVRPEIAESLMVEPADLKPEAAFFEDLKGSNNSLRDFVFRIQNRLNVSIQPTLDAVLRLVEIDNDGRLTGETLKSIQSFLPDWKPQNTPVRLTSLFTISLLESIVAKTADTGHQSPKAAAAPQDVKKRVRERIASLANTSVDRLTPRTNLSSDLGVGVQYLGVLFSTLNDDFEMDCLAVLREVERQFEFDQVGQLSPDSSKKLRDYCPSWMLLNSRS